MATKRERGIQSNVKIQKYQNNLFGISQNRDERFLQPYEAQDIINMHSLKDGTWSADKAGYSHLNATALESGAILDGLTWYIEQDGTEHLIAAVNGKLKDVDPSVGTSTNADASAGFTVGSFVDFQNFQGVLFSCDGNIATPRKWNGTTAASASGWPVSDGVNSFDTPKYIEQHQNRLVSAGFEDYPDHVIFSDFGDAEVYTQPATKATDSFIVEVAPGDGGFITGMRSIPIPNSNDDILVVFKTRGIYAIVGRSGWVGDPDAYKVVRINADFGAFNNRCVVQVGQDLFALNEYGVVSYTSANASGTIQPLGVNVNRVRDVIERINLNVVQKSWAIHLVDRREIWFGVPTGSSTTVNEFIVYKYPDQGESTSTPRWSRRVGFTASCGVLYNKTFYVGKYDGFIGQMFNASTYNGTGINWKYEYPYMDLGNELQFKRVLHPEAHFRVRGNQNVVIATKWKGGGNNDTLSDGYNVDTTVSGSLYGTAIYGTSFYGDREEITREYYCPGNGKRIKTTVSGTTNNSGPEFLGLTKKYEVGGISSHWN